MKLTIISQKTLGHIPSASGIEIIDDAIYVMGDNSPWLFKLNKSYKLTGKLSIASGKNLVNREIPKSLKPDFEAMTSIGPDKNKKLLLFGSGSKSPQRDIMLQINVCGKSRIKTYSLKKLYIPLEGSLSKTGADPFELEAKLKATLENPNKVLLTHD